VSAAELGQDTIEELRPLAVDRLGVLLGAGASAATGLPGWDTLAERLLARSGVAPDEATAKSFLAKQDAMLAAEAARAACGDWHALIRDALYNGDDEPEPAVLHLAAAALAARRDPGMVQLHTLNFDPLVGTALRLALGELGLAIDVHERAESAQGPAGHHVVNHLHGIIRAEAGGDARNVILTLKDFTDLGATPHPWQVAALQDTIQKGPLILAGTSYRDPDIRQWLSDIPRDSEVVVLLARQGLDLDRDTFDRVRVALEEQWRAVDVRPVALQDHADAAQALRELPHLGEAGYLSPRDRARRVWAAHEGSFSAKQQEQSELLAEDMYRLRTHLGAESNLTLWLADGEGNLVRWASPDRVYVKVGYLRRAAIGFDSPWVAGRCLGRDETLARDLTGPRGPTQRWKAVVAVPVSVDVAGGPPFSTAVLSSATPGELGTYDLDAWQSTVVELAAEWGDRLSQP
jgi:hypothetical protein